MAFIAGIFLASAPPSSLFAQTTLLNVSYDLSRELYKDINPAFEAEWLAKTGEKLTIKQSHGGSSKQALSVLSGLEADVVTMNQEPDIDILVQRGGLVASNWRDRLPDHASPYSTATVFLVRKGNPKSLTDWADLAKPGISIIVPNPKTSGNGRYTYLSAWGYALQSGRPDAAKDFVARLFANVPVFDGGGRGASTSFAQNGIGDALVTFENEAIALQQEFGSEAFEIVYPSVSVEAAPPVSVVDAVVDRKGSRKAATAYLEFLFSPAGQDIIARHNFRPRDPGVAAKYASRFPAIKTFTVEGLLGGWAKVQSEHFADGALYDQISSVRR